MTGLLELCKSRSTARRRHPYAAVVAKDSISGFRVFSTHSEYRQWRDNQRDTARMRKIRADNHVCGPKCEGNFHEDHGQMYREAPDGSWTPVD
jgi:hypothetical protein